MKKSIFLLLLVVTSYVLVACSAGDTPVPPAVPAASNKNRNHGQGD